MTDRAQTCSVLAELGMTMTGSVDRALDLVRACAHAGAAGVKVQLLKPDRIASSAALTYWDDTHEYETQRAAFAAGGPIDYLAWGPVREECRKLGVDFVATPFDAEAVEACVKLDVDAIKIASGDLTNVRLLEDAGSAAERLDVDLLLSTGAATQHEIEHALADPLAEINWQRVVLLACSLQYPTASADANLARIETLRRLNVCRVGYSDHTPHVWTSLAAAALGAVIVEKHVMPDDDSALSVPDTAFALTPQRLRLYVANAREGALQRGSGTLKPHDGELAARRGARRSLYWRSSLVEGDTAYVGDVIALRPFDERGMQPGDESRMHEQRVSRDVHDGELVMPQDFV